MASMVHCRNCGLTADTSAPFCEGCGLALESRRPSAPMGLGAPRTITVGRDPGCGYQLNKPTISKQHALVELLPGDRIRVQDLGSANGVAINSPGNRISEGPAEVQLGDRLFLGRTEIAVSDILLSTGQARKARSGSMEAASIRMRGNTVVFGRDASADFQIPHPMVSKRHASLTRQGSQYFIEDLGSTNGTFVRGKRLAPRVKVAVRVGDEIGFGSYTLVLNELGTLQPAPEEISITAEALAVRVNADGGTRELLGEVSLTIEPGDMVALMGPSGAGKTTFLQALNGVTPVSGGRVLYRNLDLAQHFDSFRTMIAYVPQDDIMHAQLTVYKALYYTAKLRLPADYTEAQIDERIRRVLADVGLEDKMHAVIGDAVRKTLSGGQRKRVNLAMELLSEPWVLFLDEPTSGLSAVDSRAVIELLKEKFARRNRTIIVTIHQPSFDVYSQFNLLAMISNHAPAPNAARVPGRLVYFGPTMDAFDFFAPKASGEPRKPEEIEAALLKQPVDRWVRRYNESAFQQIYVGDRKQSLASAAPAAFPPARKDRLRQLGILTRRLAELKIRDKAQLAIALALPAVFGILVSLSQSAPAAEPAGLSAFQKFLDFGKRISTAHFLMVVAATWFGCNNAIREIVGERAIYRRERLVNLSLVSYFLSKYAVLGVLGLFQCALMLAIVYPSLGLRADVLQILSMLWLTTIAGSGIGLCLSSMMRSNEQAIASLPLALLPMIVLGGSLSTVTFMHQNQPLGWLSNAAPTRWAFEGNFLLENDAQGSGARFALADIDVPAERMKDMRQQCQSTADRLQQVSGQAQACQQRMASLRRVMPPQGMSQWGSNLNFTGAGGLDFREALATSSLAQNGTHGASRLSSREPAPSSDLTPAVHPDTEGPGGFIDMAHAAFPAEAKSGEIFIPRHSWPEAMGRLAALAAFWALATLAMLKREEWKWWQGLATRLRLNR